MPRKYIGGLMGASPLAGDPVDLRTSGVFNLGSLGGDGTAPGGGDADFDSVSLLLNGDGTNGQTTFTDLSSSSHTVTTNGDTQVYGVIKKYGTGSIEFDGNGDYLRTNDFGLTSGDFTIEAWVRLKVMPTSDSWPAEYNSWMEIVGVGTTGSTDGWQFRIGETQLAFGVSGDNTAVTGTHGMSTGTWYHLAVTRSGNVYAVYVNGFTVGSATYIAQQPGSGAYGWVGSETGQGAYLNGYIDDLRITKGGAIYSSTEFTPPTSALTNTVSSGTVVLRLDGDGTNGQITFTDQSSSPITVSNNSNNVQVDTGTKKFGSGSIKFDSTTDWLYFSDLSLGTDNFTIETWLNVDLTTSPQYAQIIGNESAGIAGWTWMINGNGASTGDMRLYCGGSLVLSTASGVLTTNTWHHIALTKFGDGLQFFVDGISVATDIAHGFNFSNASASTAIGRNLLFTPRNLVGYMDDFRITKGAALYPYFTPPTSALTNTVSSGTVDFRLNGDGNQGDTTFTDLSSSPYTITQFGDAKVRLYSKYGTGSIKFDGTGDYLDLSVNSDFTFDGDFTVEAWVYPNTAGTFMPIIDGRADNTAFQNYYFGLTNVSQTLRTDLILASGGAGRIGTTNAVPTGQWSHIAFVRNNGVITPYVNGVADATTKSDGTTLTPSNFRVGATPAASGTQYYFDGYIDDIRVTKGVARYSSSFTPPTSALSADVSDITGSDDVVLLLDGTSVNDGSTGGLNDATLQADASANDTTVTDPYGGSTGSYKLDGTGDYLSISDSEDFNMGSGDFTAECWAYFNSLSTTEPFIMGQWSGTLNAGTLNWAIMLSTNTGYVRFLTSSNGNGVLFDLSTSTTSFSLSTSTWYHIAAVRNGSSFKIFVDGVERASTTNTSALYNATNAFTIGAESDGQEQAMNGYLKDIRVTKGAALYPFHPPNSALPTTGTVAGATRPTRNWGGLVGRGISVTTETVLDADFNKVLLLLDGDGTSGSNTFTDKSNASPTIAVNGNPEVITSVKKFGTGSIDLDGTGDYLEVDFEYNIGVSGDPFTVECWVYFDTLNDEGVINLTQGGFGQGGNSLAIGYYNSEWRFYDDNTGQATGVTPGPSTGQWYHTAIVFDGTDLVFYIDGQARLTRLNHASNMPAGGYPTVIFGGYFGAGYELDGKIDGIRVTKGVARYTNNFTPPASALTNTVSSGTVVLRLDGDNNITDHSSSGHTMSWPVSSAYHSSGKFNQALDLTSTFLEGPTTTQTSNFQFGTGDFTLESWVYWPSGITTDDKCLFESRSAAFDAGLVWFFQGNTNGTLTHRVYNDNVLQNASSTGSFSLNTWHHVALVRNGNIFTYFTDGQDVGSFTFTGSVNQTGLDPLRIGGRTDSTTTPVAGIQGYVDDFRVTKGAALYPDTGRTGELVPPTSALPTTRTASTTNAPTTGILSVAEHYSSKL